MILHQWFDKQNTTGNENQYKHIHQEDCSSFSI